jgi:hypothetical protein
MATNLVAQRTVCLMLGIHAKEDLVQNQFAPLFVEIASKQLTKYAIMVRSLVVQHVKLLIPVIIVQEQMEGFRFVREYAEILFEFQLKSVTTETKLAAQRVANWILDTLALELLDPSQHVPLYVETTLRLVQSNAITETGLDVKAV